MTIWYSATLSDLISIKHGYAFKGEFFSDQGNHIVLTPGNFFEEGGFRLRPGKEKFYSGPIPDQYVLSKGDLIVAMTEQGEGLLGSSAIIPASGKFLHNQRLGLIKPLDPSKCHSGYLYYLFNSHRVRQHIRATASGAKVRHTSPTRIGEVKVNIPPISIQRRIASILSAYDYLIENNTRRIAILEEMSRRLYEEWFVNFRFPGHEQVRMVESELGLIPRGWEVTKIGVAFTTVLGGTPSRGKPEYWDGGTVPWINSGKVNELRILEPSELITDIALNKSSTKLMPIGTTLLAITGATLGQVSILCSEMCANQSVVGIVDPTGFQSEYIYRTIQARIHEIILHASGGAQQHINKEVVNDVLVLQPDIETLQAFNVIAVPMGKMISTLMKKNTNLHAQRDLLLPKLISGEIDVSAFPEPEAGAA